MCDFDPKTKISLFFMHRHKSTRNSQRNIQSNGLTKKRKSTEYVYIGENIYNFAAIMLLLLLFIFDVCFFFGVCFFIHY